MASDCSFCILFAGVLCDEHVKPGEVTIFDFWSCSCYHYAHKICIGSVKLQRMSYTIKMSYVSSVFWRLFLTIMMAARALPWWPVSLETPWDYAALHSWVSCCWDSSAHDAVSYLIFVFFMSLFVFLSFVTLRMSPLSYYTTGVNASS